MRNTRKMATDESLDKRPLPRSKPEPAEDRLEPQVELDFLLMERKRWAEEARKVYQESVRLDGLIDRANARIRELRAELGLPRR